MRRISIVGSPGSGKTTLGTRLALRLGIPHVELDDLFHMPGWAERDRESFRALLAERLAHDGWVVDGNYRSQVQDLVWSRSDTIVWLDLPRSIVMRSVIGRSLRRLVRREVLWSGNREQLLKLLDRRPRRNIVVWTWTQFGGYRSRYRRDMADTQGGGSPRWVRLTSRAEVDRWLVDVVAESKSSVVEP